MGSGSVAFYLTTVVSASDLNPFKLDEFWLEFSVRRLLQKLRSKAEIISAVVRLNASSSTLPASRSVSGYRMCVDGVLLAGMEIAQSRRRRPVVFPEGQQAASRRPVLQSGRVFGEARPLCAQALPRPVRAADEYPAYGRADRQCAGGVPADMAQQTDNISRERLSLWPILARCVSGSRLASQGSTLSAATGPERSGMVSDTGKSERRASQLGS